MPREPVIRASTLPALHRSALQSTRSFVAGVEQSQWSNATPCAEWDVRALVNHVTAGNLWAAELAAGRTIAEVGGRFDGDLLGADPLAAYDASAAVGAAAFEVAGALDAPCAVSYGPIAGSDYAGHRFLDVLVHGWDIAIATEQDPVLDPALVEACWDVIQPQLADLRASGMFGSSRPTDPDSLDPQSRVLMALGRAVP